MVAQIVNMNENVIIPQTSLKSGRLELPREAFPLSLCCVFYSNFVTINDLLDQFGPQSCKDSRYTLRMHENGYFYMLRNQTLTNNKNDEMKRDKQEIQRLTRALKGRSLRIKVDIRAFWYFTVTLEKMFRDLIKVTRHNNNVYRKMVENLKTDNSTNADLLRKGSR